jgi:hypothetical protein
MVFAIFFVFSACYTGVYIYTDGLNGSGKLGAVYGGFITILRIDHGTKFTARNEF